MRTENAVTPLQKWRDVKGEIIPLFGTISGLAQKLGCHPDAIRKAVEGRAPKVLEKLKVAIAEAQEAKALKEAQ